MREVWLIIKEQINFFPIIVRLSSYETKAKYKDHALGVIWDIINPVMQIATYWLVFGIGLGQASQKIAGDVSYLGWLVIGLATWLFINTSFMDATWSIRGNVQQVSKMNFPISIMPTVRTWINVVPFFITLAVGVLIAMLYGARPSIYWLQFIYYFFAMLAFLHALGIFNATISVLYPDYEQLIQTVMRFMFWFSGTVFDISQQVGPQHARLAKLLELNPFYYLISGTRQSFLSTGWIWQIGIQALSFWGFILAVLIIGSHVHLKFRSHFADLV